MEYIEREAAIKALKGLPTWWGDGGGWYGHAQPPMVALLDPLDAVNAIDNIPAADVVPVRHGHWKPFDLTYGRSVYYCTACNQSESVPTEMEKPIYAYCPNCGARMDGDENG